jgi:hypothetical protein
VLASGGFAIISACCELRAAEQDASPGSPELRLMFRSAFGPSVCFLDFLEKVKCWFLEGSQSLAPVVSSELPNKMLLRELRAKRVVGRVKIVISQKLKSGLLKTQNAADVGRTYHSWYRCRRGGRAPNNTPTAMSQLS